VIVHLVGLGVWYWRSHLFCRRSLHTRLDGHAKEQHVDLRILISIILLFSSPFSVNHASSEKISISRLKKKLIGYDSWSHRIPTFHSRGNSCTAVTLCGRSLKTFVALCTEDFDTTHWAHDGRNDFLGIVSIWAPEMSSFSSVKTLLFALYLFPTLSLSFEMFHYSAYGYFTRHLWRNIFSYETFGYVYFVPPTLQRHRKWTHFIRQQTFLTRTGHLLCMRGKIQPGDRLMFRH
jgi:hypothetical protein